MVMALLGWKRTSGQRRLGMSGQGSQFIERQKLWSFLKWTLVLTVPALRQARSWSAWVSIMTRSRIESNAVSFAARRQRSWVEPDFVSTIASRAFCQVRVETPESVPARYALAM